jgi:hypothetical protein
VVVGNLLSQAASAVAAGDWDRAERCARLAFMKAEIEGITLS